MTINEFERRKCAKTTIESENYVSQTETLYSMYFKKVFDFCLAVILLIPCTFIVIFFGLLIKIESNGVVLYTQIRVGKNGENFKIYKLRSMFNNSDCIGPLYTLETDSRITKVGRIIRRFRFDELPQIFNIIQGQMSFIGPRPLTEFEYENTSKDFKKRLLVLPGISGLAQVSGGNDLSNEKKLEYDLSYIRTMSLKSDINITCRTIIVIVSGKGSR
jgi:lipopolysaccharide/colanic/teichoic acid biosynthesis glycosyltransferase